MDDIDYSDKLTEIIRNNDISSITIVQNDYVSMTIFSFDKGEEISTHAVYGEEKFKMQLVVSY